MSDVVLVTGMGGNVGQGIVRSIRALSPALRIVGTNTAAMSAGNHLCDAFYLVPGAVEADYLDRMQAICADEQVALIIPSTDYETYHLSRSSISLPSFPKVATSPAETCRVFLDKLETARFFSAHAIPFAASFLPSEYDGRFARTIVKPREGRGSRGICVDPPDLRAFGDDYVVQERHEGVEITSAFYVRGDGEIHGHVTMARSLSLGMTSACEITFAYDEAIERIAQAIVGALPVRGSCNLQSIVTASGQVVPFEVNGRLSGTASIRGQLGFPDACWTVEEHLWGRPLAPPRVEPGAAVRISLDVIYRGRSLVAAADPHAPFEIF